METAFIAGATGYTGREVARQLATSDMRPIAHVRPDSSRLEAWRAHFGELGVEVDSTPWRREEMSARLSELRPTLVFALLGTTRKREKRAAAGGTDASYEAVDYGLTKLLMDSAGDAAEATGVRPRFVYLSSMGVSERARGAYLQVRWRAEEALRASGLPFVIARPSFITGRDRDEARPGERIGAAVSDGVLRVAGMLGQRKLRERYRSTDAATLARALIAHGRAPDSAGRVLSSDELRAAP
ncbi:NAD(P)H-binding protein [Haliangium ochraceum]|uniref:NAD-dependent epimerase/dehydratase n=1 Tax=Haliangium ochraceum (strain DSM 14365 / JCM 11303 / SMP-2) TaxID=502025 RepID=D0LYP1_HALO1|nr:NAD(P)H-binding protein [Haliangium ochraceum]ACY17907.1 NAD-dependent epimerase/dehydratase [Haliangium ochraceum DSM 14365]